MVGVLEVLEVLKIIDSSILLCLFGLPMLGATLLLFIPSSALKIIKIVAFAVSLVVAVLAIYIFVSFDETLGGIQFQRIYGWLPLPGPWGSGDDAITLSLGIDGVSATMVLLTGIVMLTGTLISWNVKESTKDFFILYFVLLSGVFGVFVTFDLFFFFLFYELSVLPMYLLIGKWGSTSKFKSFVRTKE